MLQLRGDADLPLESVGAHGRAELGMEHFERDDSLALVIAREIDRRHAAPAEHTFDLVAIRQGGLNPCQVISQDGQLRWDLPRWLRPELSASRLPLNYWAS